jgi:hypothetical protein
MVPIFDHYNQIKGGKIMIGEESIAFLNSNDDDYYMVLREDLTESYLNVIRTGAKIDWVQVEANFSRLTVE